MELENIRVERRGPVAIVTLDRPGKRNALHGPMWYALGKLPEVFADDPPRVMILTGAGEHFSAGMDLGFDNPLLQRLMPALQDQDADAARALIVELKACVNAVANLPFPVIAAIEGACAGGALEVALCADLRVASSTAFFSMPELQVGLAPDVGGTVRLVRVIGRSRASELLLTGRRLDADTACQWGLVHRTCDAGQALRRALDLASEVMASAPVATRAVLTPLRAADGLDDTEAFGLETEAGVAAILGGEVMEGAMSFLQKRRPTWAEDPT